MVFMESYMGNLKKGGGVKLTETEWNSGCLGLEGEGKGGKLIKVFKLSVQHGDYS